MGGGGSSRGQVQTPQTPDLDALAPARWAALLPGGGLKLFAQRKHISLLPWHVQKGGSSVPGSNPVVSFANRGALSQRFAFCISVGGPVRATATPIWQGC